MVEQRDSDHETDTVDAGGESDSEWLVVGFDDTGAPTDPENAKLRMVFSDEATVKMLTQPREEEIKLGVWRLGMCHAGVTLWEWDIDTGELRIDRLAVGPPLCYDSLEGLEGNTWEYIAHERDRKRVIEALKTYEETGYVSFDCCFRLATEIPRWVHARDMQLLLNANEEPVQVIGIFFDVTESQIARDHVYWGKELPEYESGDRINWLRLLSEVERHDIDGDRIDEIKSQSQSVFRSLMILSDIPAFRKNADLEYLEVNKAFERLVGLSSEEILKRSDEELWGKAASDHLAMLCKRALNGESVQEDHVRRVDGESLEFYDKVQPDWDSTGRISGVRGIMFCIGPEGFLQKKRNCRTGRKSRLICGLLIKSSIWQHRAIAWCC